MSTTSPLPSRLPPLIGRVYCVGDDVGADDILAPEYLTFDLDDPQERRWLGAYALAGLSGQSGEFVAVGGFKSPFSIVVAGRRFGHGSARLHSPISLAEAGVGCVVAETFSSGFLRAATNAGLLLGLTFARSGEWKRVETGAKVRIDLEQPALHVGSERLALTPPGARRDIVQAGGLAEYLRHTIPVQPAAPPR